MIEDALTRASMYRFLASVYLAPPTEDLVCELRKLGLTATADLDSLRQEYESLFVVPLGQYTTPYEAVYRDEREVAGKKVRGLLMGPSTIDAIRRYREAGAKLDQEIKELPDHIGVELAFMEYLCQLEADALKNGDAILVRDIQMRQADFLKDHLQQWVPLLSQRIRENGRMDFYKDLASLTEDIVRGNLNFLGGHLGPCEQSSTVS